MTAQIDDRLLERWQTSTRHQAEARRFLARQRFSDPRGERHALEVITATLVAIESLQRRQAKPGQRPTGAG
jgi:hypothetical protein